MAELGVLSGVAGLVSLGITLCKGLLNFYTSVRDVSDDVEKTFQSIESLSKILVKIERSLEHPSITMIENDDIRDCIMSCQTGFDSLLTKVKKLKSRSGSGLMRDKLANAKQRMTYPFKESTLAKTRELCAELQSNLGVALQRLHLYERT